MNKETTYLTWVLVLSGLATLGLAIWFIASAIRGEFENGEETIFWDRVAGCAIPLAIFGICLYLPLVPRYQCQVQKGLRHAQSLMRPTPYPDINNLLTAILSQILLILGDKLVGLYLYGSLVTGDFDHDISDIDLLAAISSDLDPIEFNHLQQMHNDLAARNKQWDNRIEIAYLSTAALKTYKSHPSNIAIISPGEPFHIKEAGKDWLINWYMVREKGVTLYGPPPQTIIDPITKQEFIQAVIDQIKDWGEWIDHIQSRPYQAYAILTMCRALYAYKSGDQVSKKQAALWAQKELPEWASLIQSALSWREAYRDREVDHKATLPQTIKFVRFVVARITGTVHAGEQNKD